MRIIRYRDSDGAIAYGIEGRHGAEACAGDPFAGLVPLGRPARIAARLAPVVPSQILAIGLNYRAHALETGARLPEHPVVFSKGLGAVQDPGAPIRLPRRLASDEVDYEGELAVVIGRTCRDVPRHAALSVVLGYCCANDVSARDWQKRKGGSQWWRGKSFDTFCPLGPVLVTADEIGDPGCLRLATRLNGETVQASTTADLIFDIPAIIAFLSGDTTLPAGTVILTGTPSGVGMARTPPRWLAAGDRVEVEIEGLGVLENPVE